MEKTLSDFYGSNFKRTRGKAKAGFIRPTLSEFFKSDSNFTEIEGSAGGWIRTLAGGSSGYDSGYGVTTDSSNNIYVTGYWYNGANHDIFITKYNSSGVIQWQRTLAGGVTGNYGYAITTDSSNNIYVTGNWHNGVNGDIFITKYNSSGVIQWQRTLAGGSSGNYGYAITTDSSNNIYVTGNLHNGVNGDIFITKYNDSGVIQWQRTLAGGGGNDIGYGITMDSSNNIYVTGYWYNGANYGIFITKYNSSGVIQWQRTLAGGSGHDYGYAITTDSSNNIYVTGNWHNGANSDIFITKYNSSGVIQWQRTLAGGSHDSGNAITTDSSNNIYVTGYWYNGANYYIFITKLPNDGSGIGTYGDFTYAESTLIDSAASLTDSAGSLTDSAGSLVDSAGSLNDSAGSLTEGTPYELE